MFLRNVGISANLHGVKTCRNNVYIFTARRISNLEVHNDVIAPTS
jgi:hypothetical protein